MKRDWKREGKGREEEREVKGRGGTRPPNIFWPRTAPVRTHYRDELKFYDSEFLNLFACAQHGT